MIYLLIYFGVLTLGLLLLGAQIRADLIVPKEPKKNAAADCWLTFWFAVLWPIGLVWIFICLLIVGCEAIWKAPGKVIAARRRRHHIEERIPLKDARK